MTYKNCNNNYDFIRVIAIFSVIVLHTSSGPFKVLGDHWWQFNVIMSMVRWCVPVLFMLSGALLINKNESIKMFFQKRTSRIIIPLIFWSYIYIVFARNFHELDPAHANPNVFINPLLLFKYPAYFHLWFLYAIIGVYLMIPLLRLIAKSDQVTMYAIIMWFIWFSVIPFARSFGYLNGNLFFMFKLDVIPSWSGFALLGFFIQKKHSMIKSSYGIALSMLGLIATIILTYFASMDGIPRETFQSYHMPNIIIMASGVYMFLLKIKHPPLVACRIAKYSFGIYLCHMLVMPFVWKISPFSNEKLVKLGAILAIPSSMITFSISLLAIYLICKTPILKRVV